MIRPDPNVAPFSPTANGLTALDPELGTDRVHLLGTLVGPDGSVGFLRTDSGVVQQVVPGDLFNGWQVAEINEGAMVLERDGESRTILLRDPHAN